ncbi:MAG: OmpH family outer membrane protein [Chthoniobacterales bacterium]|nr:OmpH family outer membrane protein [Chthoniobacterales bacterium]
MNRMRQGLLLCLLASCLPATGKAQAQLKIGTVDMNRVFQSYSKTAEAEKKIAAAKEAATRELNDRADAYKKAVAEVKLLDTRLEGPALSEEGKAAKTEERNGKIAQIRTMEREIAEFRRTREEQIQQQIQRTKEQLVQDITTVVFEIVKEKKMDLVFDKSGASFNGFSPVLFAREIDDFTAEVIAQLKKSATKP